MDLPAEPQLRWILSRTATLLEQGAEPVRGLVLPTGEFFPDRFDASPKAVATLMTRVQDHAGFERGQLQPFEQILPDFCMQHRGSIVAPGRAIEGAPHPAWIKGVGTNIIAHGDYDATVAPAAGKAAPWTDASPRGAAWRAACNGACAAAPARVCPGASAEIFRR